MRNLKNRALILLFLSTPALAAQDTTGLKYSVAADLVGQLGLKHLKTPPPERDRMLVREAEFSFYGPIDHIFEGTVTGAAHFEDGEQNFELHEGFLQASGLIDGLLLKGGLFMLGVGRLNRIHRHDWAFTIAPKVQEEFFGEEAAFDTGLEASYRIPLPFYLNLAAGVTSGHTYGHTHTAGARPLTPTHYARLSTYQDLGESTGMDVGLNYLSRTTATNEKTSFYGADFIAKWTEGKRCYFLLQMEAWMQELQTVGAPLEKKFGTYTYPQVGLSEEFLVGLRLDTFSDLKKTNARTLQHEANIEYSFVPTITYKPSEFSLLRLSYTETTYKELSEKTKLDKLLALQVTFILGAHPAHIF